MFEVYKFPAGYLPFWHIGARMYAGPFNRFLERIKNEGKVDFLDAGAGSGWNSIMAAMKGFRVTSTDVSKNSREGIISIAQKVGVSGNISVQYADCEHLPFADDSFDAAISSHVIEHIESPTEMLKEIFRVLKPGGRFLLLCPSTAHWMKLTRLMGHSIEPPDHKVPGYDISQIRAMLPKRLVIRKAEYYGRILESNLMDLQGIFSLVTGVRANAVEDESLTPEEAKPAFYSKHWRIFSGLRGKDGGIKAGKWLLGIVYVAKELVILPLLLLCKLENILFSFMKGSLIVVELTKE